MIEGNEDTVSFSKEDGVSAFFYYLQSFFFVGLIVSIITLILFVTANGLAVNQKMMEQQKIASVEKEVPKKYAAYSKSIKSEENKKASKVEESKQLFTEALEESKRLSNRQGTMKTTPTLQPSRSKPTEGTTKECNQPPAPQPRSTSVHC